MSVTSTVDFGKIKREFNETKRQAQKALNNAIIMDTQPYVPMKSGVLMNSPKKFDLELPFITYDTVYARYQYFGIDFNHPKPNNPYATAEWFKHSKRVNLDRWIKLVRRMYGQ